MRQTDTETSAAPRLRDIAVAMSLLTRFPVPSSAFAHGNRGASAAWAWPIVGAAVAGAGALAGGLALAAGTGPWLAAGLALLVATLATGGLHEDGLADFSDGIWGGRTPERRLEIMHDSRIGSYGVLALVFGTGLRWSALASLFEAGHTLWPLVAVAMLSRAALVAVMRALPPARKDGLSATMGRPPMLALQIAATLAVLVPFLTLGPLAGWAIAGAAIAAYLVAHTAHRRIGGQTGDVLGAAQQASETLALIALAAALA